MEKVIAIVKLAQENTLFRRELVTAGYCQVVLMCLQPKQDIGMEVHKVDQLLFIVAGLGKAVLNGEVIQCGVGSLIVVPAGTNHNIINTENTELKLYTVYAPSQHKPGTVHKTKAEAGTYEER